MNKLKENRKLGILVFISIAWIAVIFSFSLQSGDESGKLSGGIVAWFVGLFFPEDFTHIELVHFLVRKAAHFTEYFILGVLLSLTVREAKWKRILLAPWIMGTCVACCDETIQLFSEGRAGMITDVMLDSSGVFIGCVVLALSMLLVKKFNRKKTCYAIRYERR